MCNHVQSYQEQYTMHKRVQGKATIAHQYIVCFVLLICFVRYHPITEAANLLRSHSPYLYAGDAFPIIEYILSHNVESEKVNEEKNLPSFLYDTDLGYRVVQFYASRTEPTALRLRDSYIQIAYLVTQAVQELSPSNVTIDTYAVCCTTVPSLCEQQGYDFNTNHDKHLPPIFMIYPPGSSKGKKLMKFNVKTILDEMKISTDDQQQQIDLGGPTAHIDLLELSNGNEVHTRTIDELQEDIHLSLYTVMRDHVFIDHDEHGNLTPLSIEKRNALKKYLLLIQKSVPETWSVHAMVKQLISSFMYVCKNRGYLIASLDAYAPKQVDYSPACSMGMSHISGITCGTWELIHAVTVGVVERNKMALNKAEEQPSKAITSLNYTNNRAFTSNEEAAGTLRDYFHFFGIGDDEIERQELVSQLDGCLEERCLSTNTTTSMPIVSQWIQLPLYFSKIHTSIRVKRQRDVAKKNRRTMSPIEQQMISTWPPKYACPQCWDAHGQWDTNIVYKYMQLEYTDLKEWSMSSPEIRQELLGANGTHLLQQRQLTASNTYLNSRDSYTVLMIQKLVVLVSAFGAVLYRYQMYQQKQQATMLVLPQTIRSKVSRNKSLKQSSLLSYLYDQKKS